MSVPRQPRSGFQIGLKWLLIGVPILGAALGLLARLFFYDPNYFRLAISVVTIVAPFLLAVGTIVRLGWKSGQRRLLVWGSLLAIAPLIGFLVLTVANKYYGNAPHGLGVIPNTVLIDQRLPQEIEAPWVWEELSRRNRAGSLTPTEVEDAVCKFIAHMKKKRPQGWNQPLHWQDDFLASAINNQQVSDAVLFDLCDAFYGTTPHINRLSRVRPGASNPNLALEFGNVWADHSGLPLRLVWTVNKILVDGEAVGFQVNHSHGTRWDGNFIGDFESGDHELIIEMDCAYVEAKRLIDRRDGAIEPNQWPKPSRKRWQTAVTAKLEVMPENEKLVDLSTEANDDPMALGAIRIKRFVVMPDEGRLEAYVEIQCNEQLPTPVSFDVTAKIGGQDVKLGPFMMVNLPDSTVSTGSELRVLIVKLADKVKTAEVLFTPNSAHVENMPGVTKIWGKPVLFRNIPVERFDIDDTQNSVPANPAESSVQ